MIYVIIFHQVDICKERIAMVELGSIYWGVGDRMIQKALLVHAESDNC